MKDKSTKSLQSYLLAAAGCIILTILDQLTKWLAVVHLKDQEPFVIFNASRYTPSSTLQRMELLKTGYMGTLLSLIHIFLCKSS